MFFIDLIPFQTIYEFLLRISKHCEIRVFSSISFASKTAVAEFLTNIMYGYNTGHQTGGF